MVLIGFLVAILGVMIGILAVTLMTVFGRNSLRRENPYILLAGFFLALILMMIGVTIIIVAPGSPLAC